MNYLNFTKYIYLAVGFVMVYYAIADWKDNTDEAYLCLIVAGLAFFTFFFRSRFGKKFENRKNNNQPKQ